MSSTINIKIQGREYSLRSQEPEEQIQRVVEFVEQKLEETSAGRSVDTRDLTVLTLLNIAGQYLHLKEERRGQENIYRERLERLVDKLKKDNSGC